MTVDLDRLLEPGETVVFRARGRSLARIWFSGSTIIVSSIAFAMLINARELQTLPNLNALNLALGIIGVTAFVMALIGGVIFAFAWRRQRRSSDEVLITDRRVLFYDSDWDNKFETMALSEVERISWSANGEPGALDVMGADRIICLPVMREADAIARALGGATDKPHPQPVGRMAILNLSLFGMVAIVGGTYFVLAYSFETMGFLPPADTSVLDFGWKAWIFKGIAIGTGIVLAWLLGDLPGKLLTATVMRPLVTAEQMRAGLCAGQGDCWRIRSALKWASLLYGCPLSYVSNGPETVPHPGPLP